MDTYVAFSIGYFWYDLMLIIGYGFDEAWATFTSTPGKVRSTLASLSALSV